MFNLCPFASPPAIEELDDPELAAIAGLTFADASIIQLTGAAAAAVLTSGGNHYFLKSTSDNSAIEFATPANALSAIGGQAAGTYGSPTEIDGSAAASPTAAQLAACNATSIHNYGQAAANVNITLPTPAANLGALCTVSTAQAANYWRFTCTGKIYLNGSATAKNYVQYATPAVGYYFSFFTAKIADGSYAYYVSDGVGALATN